MKNVPIRLPAPSIVQLDEAGWNRLLGVGVREQAPTSRGEKRGGGRKSVTVTAVPAT